MKIIALPYSNGQTSITLEPETEAETHQLNALVKDLVQFRTKFDATRHWKHHKLVGKN